MSVFPLDPRGPDAEATCLSWGSWRAGALPLPPDWGVKVQRPCPIPRVRAALRSPRKVSGCYRDQCPFRPVILQLPPTPRTYQASCPCLTFAQAGP